MTRTKAIQPHFETGSFDALAYAAMIKATAKSDHTRAAYANDLRRWTEFCNSRGIDPRDPHDLAVEGWIEEMKKAKVAPKTRARRIAALCAIYRRLRKERRSGGGGKPIPPAVTHNPFSMDEGPDRETALAVRPTPSASPRDIAKILETCDQTPLGIRDAAIIRVLWGTAARRSSLLDMTFERLQRDRTDYIASLVAKGNKNVPVLIRGHAAAALAAWIAVCKDGGITTGPIWRTKTAETLTARSIDRMLKRRAKTAGVTSKVSPHTFRVAFLTYNPAGLEAKQDAAGHADPATTRLYDRKNWRGREAFERMTEIEDTEE
jgi:site-specific recombinase XerD